MSEVNETVEITMSDQTGLPSESPVEPSGEIVPTGDNSNPQLESTPEQPQNNNLSTSNSQILCGLDDCKESFESLALLKDHLKKAHNVNSAPGRPCEYCTNKDKYQALAEDYLKKSRQKTGEKVAIPFIEELADILDVEDDTLKHWADRKIPGTDILEHPEFTKVYKRILGVQKLRLLQRTLGRYNPTGAIFQLKANHGLIETEKKVLAGDGNSPLEIVIIEEDKKRLSEDE